MRGCIGGMSFDLESGRVCCPGSVQKLPREAPWPARAVGHGLPNPLQLSVRPGTLAALHCAIGGECSLIGFALYHRAEALLIRSHHQERNQVPSLDMFITGSMHP